MKTFTLTVLALTACLALPARQARAGAPLWVNRTPTEFNALLDADGDLDAVVADRETGFLRIGRRTGADTLAWETTPVQSGIAPLDGMAAGFVVTNTRQSVALAGMLANRVALIDLNSSTTARVPQPLFPRHAGPHLVAALDALPASHGDELFLTTDLNGGGTGNHRHFFRRSADGSMAEDDYSAGSTTPSFCAATTTTNNAVPRVAALVPSSGRIWLFGVSTNAATLGPFQSISVIETTQFVYGFFAPGAAYGQFLLYAPGTASARRVALQADATYGASFGPSTSYTLPAVPSHIAPGPATNPNDADSDNDTFTDRQERAAGTNPNSTNSFPGVFNPSLAFKALPSPYDGLIAGLTTPAHFDLDTTQTNKTIGRELVKLVVAPTVAPVAVSYTWSGGAQATEVTAWSNAARIAYSAATRLVRNDSLTHLDTLTAALFEAFAARELQARGLIETNAVSLFPARSEPNAWVHPSADQLLALQSADVGDRSAYGLTNTLAWLRASCTTNRHAQVAALTNVAWNVYRYASSRMSAAPGQYPLPLDALRQVLRSGTVPGGYTNHISAATAATAKLGADRLLGLIPTRQRVTLDLLAGGPQPPDTTVLLNPVSHLRYSLVAPDGDAFGLSFALAVPSNSTIHVDGFLNGPDTRRGANDEVEVISLTVTALPAPTPGDRNANLLPDAYELLVFGTAGAAPTRDADHDGFSDLQEYLEGSDPADTNSVPGTVPLSLAVPEVSISQTSGTHIAVSCEWPARYQHRFLFTLETTADLTHTAFTDHSTAVIVSSGDTLRCDLSLTPEGPQRFYRIRVALR